MNLVRRIGDSGLLIDISGKINLDLLMFPSQLVDAVMHRIGWRLLDGLPWFEGMMTACFESIGTAKK